MTRVDDPYSLNVDDFVVHAETETVQRCPAGFRPLASVHDSENGVTKTTMPTEACAGCRFGRECPVNRQDGEFRLTHTAKERRLTERRREQATEAFRENYRKRSGGESTNSGLKRRMGLGRSRVRGLQAVAHAIYLRVAGWNILRAAASPQLRARLQAALQQTAAALRDQVSLPRLTACLSDSPSPLSALKIVGLCGRHATCGAAIAA